MGLIDVTLDDFLKNGVVSKPNDSYFHVSFNATMIRVPALNDLGIVKKNYEVLEEAYIAYMQHDSTNED